MKAIRLTLNVAVFGLTLLVGARIIGGRFPDYPPEIGEKLAYFRQHKDSYDVLFLGSSVIRFQVNPAVFDRECARLGQPVRSFNFGIDGMWGHEMNVLADECLNLRPRRLKSLFLDTRNWMWDLHPSERFAVRTIWWHTTRESLSVCRNALASGPSWKRKLRAIYQHFLHWGMRQWKVGRSSREIRAIWMVEPVKNGVYADYTRYEGFTPLPIADGFSRKLFPRLRNNSTDIEAFRQKVEEIRINKTREPAAGKADPRMARLIERQQERIRASGVEPIYLTPPAHYDERLIERLARRGVVSSHFDFFDPARYPSLYAIENRHDFGHLNSRGANEFSILLARRYVGHLDRDE